MNKKRIRRDYENVDYVDAKGKVRTQVCYRGATYSPAQPRRFATMRVLFAVLFLFAVSLFVLPLCFNLQVTRTVYFTMPFVFQIFVLFMLAMATYRLVFSRPPYREEVYHTVLSRPRAALYIGLGLSMVCVISFAVYAARGGTGLDYLALGCILGLLVCYALMLTMLYRVVYDRSAPAEQPDDASAAPSDEAIEAPASDTPSESQEDSDATPDSVEQSDAVVSDARQGDEYI